MDLHERLISILQIRGMSQQQLAEAIDYSPSTISNWVKGKRPPTSEGLMLLCKTLHVSTDWLLFGAQSNSDQPVSIIPTWEAVDATFSTANVRFDDFLETSQSLFFTSVWLPRAFDVHNPVMSALVQKRIPMRFVFPKLELILEPYDTNGPHSTSQYERKKLAVLSTFYQIQEWCELCSIEIRLITARPVANLLATNYHSNQGRMLYIPYLYGDFEYGPRPGFVIDQQKHPEWYDQFYGRYVSQLWSDAVPVDNLESLIEQLRKMDISV